METVLYRSESDRMLGGVCGGLAKYLQIDSTLMRLFFVLLVLGPGIGVLLYLILWIIVPKESQVGTQMDWNKDFNERAQNIGTEFKQAIRSPHPQSGMILGGALIAIGSMLFIKALHISWLWWLNMDVLWPIFLIIGGVVILMRRTQGTVK